MKPSIAFALLSLAVLTACQTRPEKISGYCGTKLPAWGRNDSKDWKKFSPLGTIPPKAKWTFTSGNEQRPMSRWLPAGKPRTVVVFAPGQDGASSDPAPLGRFLARRGIALYVLDLRGQGHDQDMRQRGRFKDWPIWTRDFLALDSHVRRSHPGVPVFFGGQSLGCLVALDAATHATAACQPRGILLHSFPFPYVYPGAKVSVALPIYATFSDKAVPASKVLVDSRQHLLSAKARALELAYLSRPERAFMTPDYGVTALRLGRHVRGELDEIRRPVLLQIGCLDGMAALAADASTCIDKLRTAMRNVPRQVQVKTHPNGHHELLIDPYVNANVFAADLRWIEQFL